MLKSMTMTRISSGIKVGQSTNQQEGMMVSEVRHYRDIVKLDMYASINDRIAQLKRQSKCPKHHYVITSTLSGVFGHVTFQCTHCAKIVNAPRQGLDSDIYLGRVYQKRKEYERSVSRS